MSTVVSNASEAPAVNAAATESSDPPQNDNTALEAPSLTFLEICAIVICVLLTLAFMRWAEAFLVPVLVGVLLSYTFDPAVTALERWHIRRVVGAALVLGSFSAGCGALVYVLSDD